MAEKTRRDFLKKSAVAAIPTSLVSMLAKDSQAHPPRGNFGVIPRPHFDFHITPWGTFSHMRWGRFNVVRPIYPINPPIIHRIPQQIQYRYQGVVHRVDPRKQPQGIIASGFLPDRNRNDGRDLDEYSRLNQRCYDSTEGFKFVIQMGGKGQFENCSYDMRVFGPKDLLAGRKKGTIDGRHHPTGTLNLAQLAKAPDHGPGNYCVEYLVNNKIRERRSFTLVDKHQGPGIPSGKEPHEYGIKLDDDNLGIFIAGDFYGTDRKNVELSQLERINQACYGKRDEMHFGFFNGSGFRGNSSLTLFAGEQSKDYETIDVKSGWLNGWWFKEGDFTAGDYRFSVEFDGKIDGKEIGYQTIPRDFKVA